MVLKEVPHDPLERTTPIPTEDRSAIMLVLRQPNNPLHVARIWSQKIVRECTGVPSGGMCGDRQGTVSYVESDDVEGFPDLGLHAEGDDDV